MLLLLLSVVLVGVGIALPSRAAAAEQYWLRGTSAWAETQANFAQQVSAWECHTVDGGYGVTARMVFRNRPSFARTNVRGCAMHVTLVRHGHGPVSDIVTPCTHQARTYDLWTLYVAGGWGGLPGGDYHVTGWINIQAGSYYNTFDRAAGYSFTLGAWSGP